MSLHVLSGAHNACEHCPGKVGIFSKWDLDHLSALAWLSKAYHVPKGDVIHREGTVSEFFSVVYRGTVSVDMRGSQSVLATSDSRLDPSSLPRTEVGSSVPSSNSDPGALAGRRPRIEVHTRKTVQAGQSSMTIQSGQFIGETGLLEFYMKRDQVRQTGLPVTVGCDN